MLKIKDNVDLKELEKFGFKLIKDCLTPNGLKADKIDCYVKPDKNGNFRSCCTFIKCNYSREITLPIYDVDNLYDLIQAGLVEKVEDK